MVFFRGVQNEDAKAVRDAILACKVPAAAKAGGLAPTDVFVPAGPTGLDPSQTAFFQSLNIATKIVKGAIEIINEVHLLKPGERVGNSEVSLLSKLNIKPFTCMIFLPICRNIETRLRILSHYKIRNCAKPISYGLRQ